MYSSLWLTAGLGRDLPSGAREKMGRPTGDQASPLAAQ